MSMIDSNPSMQCSQFYFSLSMRVNDECHRDDKISREDAKALDFSRKAAGGEEEESKAQELTGVELAKQ